MWLLIEVIVYIFSIWSSPYEQQACLHFPTGNMAHGTIKIMKTGPFKFSKFIQKVIRLLLSWCYGWFNICKVKGVVFIDYLEICRICRIHWRNTLWRMSTNHSWMSTNRSMLLLFSLKLIHKMLSSSISSITIFHTSNLVQYIFSRVVFWSRRCWRDENIPKLIHHDFILAGKMQKVW